MSGNVIINNNKIRWGLSALLAVLLLFSTFHTVFSLVAFAICALIIFFCDREFILLQMLFIMPMANIFKMSPDAQSFFTIVLLLYVVFHLVLPRNATAIITLFAFYIVVMQLIMGEFDLFRTIKLVCNILFLSSVLNNQVKTRHREIFLSYIIGNIVASVIALMDSPTFKIVSYVGVEAIGDPDKGTQVTRFTGLYADPNYYSVGLIISLCLLVVLYHRNELKVLPSVLLACPIIYFLLITYSKSAVIMILLILVFLLYSLTVKKKFVPIIILSFSAVVIIVLAISGQVPALQVVVERFMVSDTLDGLDVNRLTTGRFNLWMTYAKHIIQNLRVIIFGNSITAGLLDDRAAHNTYIDVIYHLGTIGTVLLLVSLKAILTQSTRMKIKRNILNYSVLICILIMYFFLSELFYYDPPFHIFLAFILINLPLSKNAVTAKRIKKHFKGDL